MSVICQNFVQNAWKKDLCSNCFKSVGDHESNESSNSPDDSDSTQNDSLNGRYVSQATTVYTTRTSTTTPHTTWKSLITEKNSKNCQPFKLETGFQGRLLTINKAANEKRVHHETNTNGHAPDSQCVSNGNTQKIVNGYLKKQSMSEGSQPTKSVQPIKNGFKMQSGFTCNQNSEDKNNCNGVEHKTVKISKICFKNQDNEVLTNDELSDNNSPDEKLSESKVHSKSGKTKNEKTTAQSNLHGILKKASLTPESSNGQSRRGSNVGFIDEEPVVIGYGGRDFSPEELEWEMASSDGETENASDSLDETEDDRVFSKMTKQNTEFNSHNANLLQKNCDKNNSRKENVEKKPKILKRNENASLGSETNNKQGGNDNQKSKNIVKNKKAEISNEKIEATGVKHEENRKSKECEGKTETGISKSQCSDNFMDSTIKTSEETHHANAETISDKKDPLKIAKNCDESSHAATMGEVTIITTAEAASSGVDDVKNNPQLINGAAVSPSVVRARNAEEETRAKDAGMFSEDGEQRETWQEESGDADGSIDWSESDALSGQILQAINTSLTNRHKMREAPKPETDSLVAVSADGDEQTGCDQGNIHAGHEIANNNMSLPANGSEAIDTSDVTTGNIERSNEEEQTETAMNVEPRPSFLHGTVSNERISKPSAIYGPASDLFVSRSNSSSSSSSDEFDKSRISINVIVNGDDVSEKCDVTENEVEEPLREEKQENEATSNAANRMKPKIPAKPSKQSSATYLKQRDADCYTKSKFKDGKFNFISKRKSEDSITQDDDYYSPVSDSPKSITLVDHYAESNIYHEVDEKTSKIDDEEVAKVPSGRDSKLAALAIELEQVRHNGTKRQAPAPPKVPDPPLEDPPSCTGRSSPSTSDVSHGFSSFRGEAMAFSSASSTTSTSSQDTETGYASWNLHGDMDEQPKYSKSKSSFLLAQYSKCKMLAMGYAEDSARARKRFSLKKLLKIGKDSEGSAAFDPSSPNPKAWKYSDHFERPRAKLEIIHPMDLENKSVTVNPGFDAMHSGSMSSFSVNSDDTSLRNSVSSDYGSYYSDTISPAQDLKSEANYEYIQPRMAVSEEQEESIGTNEMSRSTSPTPSRSSLASQASTLTSGSSKNGGAPPHRPPKPPPPPRAHSLLPGNKAQKNADGTFKFPAVNSDETTAEETAAVSPKPQAPRRQCKITIQRTEYANFEEPKVASTSDHLPPSNENLCEEKRFSVDGNKSSNTSVVQIGSFESQTMIYQDISVKNEVENHVSNNEMSSQLEEMISSMETLVEDIVLHNSEKSEHGTEESQISESECQACSPKSNVFIEKENISKSVLSRNKHPPITKAPARPPPIYSKPQASSVTKNTTPWKTLEDSYLVLTSSNRELLIKLVNQALKKRRNLLTKLQKMRFQWADFEIDASQSSSVFAFGEKIACHATIPKHPEYSVTLVITLQQENRLNESSDMKYPVFGQFTDFIPSELLDYSSETELESMQATVLVLDHSNVTTVECFTENLPESLTEENEKELCFIILQLIQSLKSLQAQGIESMESSFLNIILARAKQDKYHTLIFLSDNCYDEIDYSSEICKISLCQYALLLLFQMLKIQSTEEFLSISVTKFSCHMARKIFETAISFLSEEKAVSLSQTKTLLECFLWGVTKVLETLEFSDDADSFLHRWLDIERCIYIKNIINDENSSDINTQNEYYSQFLIRTNVRNIKEVASYL